MEEKNNIEIKRDEIGIIPVDAENFIKTTLQDLISKILAIDPDTNNERVMEYVKKDSDLEESIANVYLIKLFRKFTNDPMDISNKIDVDYPEDIDDLLVDPEAHIITEYDISCYIAEFLENIPKFEEEKELMQYLLDQFPDTNPEFVFPELDKEEEELRKTYEKYSEIYWEEWERINNELEAEDDPKLEKRARELDHAANLMQEAEEYDLPKKIVAAGDEFNYKLIKSIVQNPELYADPETTFGYIGYMYGKIIAALKEHELSKIGDKYLNQEFDSNAPGALDKVMRELAEYTKYLKDNQDELNKKQQRVRIFNSQMFEAYLTALIEEAKKDLNVEQKTK